MFLISIYAIRIFSSTWYLFHYGMKFWAYSFGSVLSHAFQCLCSSNLFFYRTHHPCICVHMCMFCITLECGEVGREVFFKIPALIEADTLPSHECIWRNVPIFKTNDDCLALLRKMRLPCQSQQHCVFEAHREVTHQWWKYPLKKGDQGHKCKMNGSFRRENSLKWNQTSLGLEETKQKGETKDRERGSWWSVRALYAIQWSKNGVWMVVCRGTIRVECAQDTRLQHSSKLQLQRVCP